jgi:hypothetical protein
MGPLILLAAATVASAALPQVPPPVAGAIGTAVDPSKGPKDGPLVMVVELFADPNGKVIDCAVRAFSGAASNAKAVCRATKGKKLVPAKDAVGEAAFGLVAFNITLGDGTGAQQLLSRPVYRFPADLVLQIAEYPGGRDGPIRVPLLVGAEANGTISSCGAQVRRDEGLSATLCAQVKQLKMPVRYDQDGNPVRYVAPFQVELTTERVSPA